jgi:sugar phosphate isomerase/epimerase
MVKREFCIDRLQSGGLITNYYCTSKCGHCLYGCSPQWEKVYIEAETAKKNLQKVKELGCDSIHVGGGEPFLNLEGLKTVLRAAKETGVAVEYVETNSSWFKDSHSSRQALEELKELGLSALLVSISPFHNEHIPFFKVKGVIEQCRNVGISIFPWILEFYSEIEAFDDRTTHKMAEYESRFGKKYLRRIPARYWIHFGGRAIKTFGTVFDRKDYKGVLSSSSLSCQELLDTSHFHLDLWGNYIPGLCSGLSIRREDLGTVISRETYPILSTLYESGIYGLSKLAESDFGFTPSGSYLSKCDLCLDIRHFLVVEKGIESHELQPGQFYENVG